MANCYNSFIEDIEQMEGFGKEWIEVPFGSNRTAMITDDKKVEYNTFGLEQMFFQDVRDFASWYFNEDGNIEFMYQIYLGEHDYVSKTNMFKNPIYKNFKIDEEAEGDDIWSCKIIAREATRGMTQSEVFPQKKKGN